MKTDISKLTYAKLGIRLFPLLSISAFFLITPHIFAGEPALAPLNPAFVRYTSSRSAARAQDAQAGDQSHGLGAIPSTVNLSYLAGLDISGLIRKSTPQGARTAATYPSSYDLRSLNRLTPVRDQGHHGTCWAFATYGSMESILMPGEPRDFSENNMANNAGYPANPMDTGGNSLMSMAYLTRWNGPVDETDDPYDAVARAGLPVQKHIQETLIIPPRVSSAYDPVFINNIKSAVQSYGGVWSGFTWDDYALAADSVSYNNSSCTEYFDCVCVSTRCGGHAITLIGWDDNYSSANFKSQPAGNGAFIARNSWGAAWGDSGYFHISYYDSSLGSENAVFEEAASTSNYTRIYQHDPLGWSQSYGDSSLYWMANIFTSSADEGIQAVGFYTTDLNVAYTLYIYAGAGADNPVGGALVYTKNGVIPISGYHTVTVDRALPVFAGQSFSAVVKLKLPDSSTAFPIAVESPVGAATAATASLGESFVSPDGGSWTDMTSLMPDTNVCLKVYAGAGGVTRLDPSFSLVAFSSVTAAWISVPGAAYTAVLASDSGYANIISSTEQTGNSAQYSGLSEGTQYFFEVKLATEADAMFAANRVSTATLLSLAGATDAPGLVWSSGGDAGWFGQSALSYYGGSAAQSGRITHNQSSSMQTTVTGPGILQFYWKVSSEAFFDYLKFYIDGVAQPGTISARIDWTQKFFSLPAGSHILKWSYEKDPATSLGLDAGWIDKVEWWPGVFMQSEPSNYPNPFAPKLGVFTRIHYSLDAPAEVKIHIYDAFGGKVWTRMFPAGSNGGNTGVNEVIWDGRTNEGRLAASGVYICAINIAGQRKVIKIGVK